MSHAAVRVRCPNQACRRVARLPGSTRGRQIRCAGCRTIMRIPPVAPSVPARKVA